MKRVFIPLDKLEIYDDMHKLQPDGSFKVDKKKDGRTTEEHRASIEYFKSILKKGKKMMPILALERGDGTYLRLDGFKRCIAYKELGYKNIEAFVCDIGEYHYQKKIPFLDSEMLCYKGGQFKEKYPLFEGRQTGDEFDYDKITFLYKSEKPDGLRIEVDEAIHIHWAAFGRYRLTLGRRDFINLAESIIKI